MSYIKKCPVCGDQFLTKISSKVFCCADCVSEYEDIKKYLSERMKDVLIGVVNEARTTKKSPEQIAKEYYKKW